MKKIILSLCAATILSGCVISGSHVVTGTVRPAIKADAVKLYPTKPQNAEVVGTLTATVSDRQPGQATTDKMLAEIKRQAAAIGANGVIVGPQDANGFLNVMNGTAIFVP